MPAGWVYCPDTITGEAEERLCISARAPSDLSACATCRGRGRGTCATAASSSWFCISKASLAPQRQASPVPAWLVSALTFKDISVGCCGLAWGN